MSDFGTAYAGNVDRPSEALARRWAFPVILLAIGIAAYIQHRPVPEFVTYSDILFGLGFALLMAGRLTPMQPFGPLTPVWQLSVGLMLTGLLIGSIVNGDPVRWLIAAVQYGFSFMLLPYVLIGHPEQRVFTMLKAFVLGICAIELGGVLVYHFYTGSYDELQNFSKDFITGGRRLGNFLGNPNWNGAMCAMTLPMVLYLRLKGQIGIIVAVIAFGAVGAGLVYSASFTGFTAGVITMGVFMVVGRVFPSLRVIGIGLAAIALYFASGQGLPQAFSTRVAPALETGDMDEAGTYTGRVDLIKEAWDIVENTTFIGIGVDQFRKISVYGAPVHNMYMLLWAEGGLMSLIGWLMMIGVLLTAVVLAYRRDRVAAALGICVIISFMIYSNAAPHMYARVWVVPLFTAMSAVFAVLMKRTWQEE